MRKLIAVFTLTFICYLAYSQPIPGTIGSNQTLCYSSAPSPLSFIVAPSGGILPYAYVWQRSSDGLTFSDISGRSATQAVYSPPILSKTTWFRCRVRDASAVSAYTNVVTITVGTVLKAGTIGDAQTICYNSTPAPLVQKTAPTGGGGNYSFQWLSSLNGTTFSSIPGATSAGYSPPALTVNTYYRRTVTSTCGSVSSSVILITVNSDLTAGTIGTAQSICYNTVPSPLTQLTAPSGGTGTYSYQWQSSPDNSTWTNITGATSQGYSPAALTATTYYRRNVTSGSCGTRNSSPILISVTPNLTPGTIGSAQTICYNNVPAALTELTAPTGGTGIYTYQWQSSPDNSAWTDITGATGTGYSPAALTATTYYRRAVTSGSCGTANSASVLITVNPALTPGSIGTAQGICYNTTPAALTQLTAPTGGTGVFTYQWQSSPDNSTWTNISGATSTGYAPPALTSSTYYRRNVSSGSCTPSTVSSASILISVSSQISNAQLHDNANIDNNASANINVAITGGLSPYTVNYTRNGVAQTPVTGYSSGSNISTGPLTTGVYTYALTSVTDANGCTAQNLGTSITINVSSVNFYHYDFNYPDRASFIAAGWSYIGDAVGVYPYPPRDTEQTPASGNAMVSYDQTAHPGVIRIPVDVGDLAGAGAGTNNSRNTIFRDLDPTWTSIRMKIKSFNPTRASQQVGLYVYQNDENFVQICRTYDDVGNRITTTYEELGAGSTITQTNTTVTTNIYFRIDRNQFTELMTFYYSIDGTNWIQVASTVHPLNSGPALGIFCGGSPGGTPINADIEWAEVRTQNIDEFRAYTKDMVFNVLQGHTTTDTKNIYTYTTLNRNINWSLTTDSPWILPDAQSGTTEGLVKVGVNTAGMSAGVHTGNITLSSSQSTLPPIIIPVTVIVNPDVAVVATDWFNDRDGAMSVSTDDGQLNGSVELAANGFQGTFVANGPDLPYPTEYTALFNAGMEIGAHLTDHNCPIPGYYTDSYMRTREIEQNITELTTNTPGLNPITLAWPCGLSTYHFQGIASEYFLSARGYNFNQLEDATPADFMNLKSYNSHNTGAPLPPGDLKTVVDQTVAQHKWFNMVLHVASEQDNAISYAATKNIWVTSIGNVMKYIYQRNRFTLANYSVTTNGITFDASRLSIPSSPVKNFELAFGANDLTTLRIDYDDNRIVESVLVNGVVNAFQTKNLNGNMVLVTNIRLEPTVVKTVQVNYLSETVPRLILSANALDFSAAQGVNPPTQSFTISSNLPAQLNWTVGVSTPSWLTVTPSSGTGNTTATVSVNVSGLAIGTYSNTITVTAPGAYASPQTKTVSLTVNPAGLSHYNFTYTDRTSLLGAGWDFMAVLPTGTQRNTEQTPATGNPMVSYDQTAHPGVLRIPVDAGDLWGSLNNTRNSIFHNIPTTWTSVRLKLASFAPTGAYQQAGIVVYQDDNNYYQMARANDGLNKLAFIRERSTYNPVEADLSFSVTTNIYLRLDRDELNQNISAFYSTDGTVWNQVGNLITGQTALTNPRVGVVVGGSTGGLPNADIAWVEVIYSSAKGSGDNTGTTKEIASDNSFAALPDIFIMQENKLHQNYPNPFTSDTWIEYDIATDSHVTLELFNSSGRKVETIVDQEMSAGNYKFNWTSKNYSPGIYYLSMRAGLYTNRIKMIMLK